MAVGFIRVSLPRCRDFSLDVLQVRFRTPLVPGNFFDCRPSGALFFQFNLIKFGGF